MISVITGSEGFIGRNLANKLLALGHTVHCLDVRHTPGPNDSRRLCRHILDCRDLEKLGAHPVFSKADYIFYLAAITKGICLEKFRQVNVYPVEALLAGLVKAAHEPKRLVFISSQAAAGPGADPSAPVREQNHPGPVEYYGQSKLEAERILHTYAGAIPFTIIRPSAVYGPGDRDFLKLYKMLSSGLNIFHGNSSQPISIIHVEDLTDGIISAARSEQTIDKTYFLTGNEIVTWRDIHGHISAWLNRNPLEINLSVPFVTLLARAGDAAARISGSPSLLNSQKIRLSRAPGWICSAERANHDFGFTTRYLLPEGIEMTGHWYRQNGWL